MFGEITAQSRCQTVQFQIKLNKIAENRGGMCPVQYSMPGDASADTTVLGMECCAVFLL